MRRRGDAPRAATLRIRQDAELEEFACSEPRPERPRTRVDCEDAERPCPWVSCRHHLYLDVTPAGNVRLNFPQARDADGAPDVRLLPATCSLDVAAQGGQNMREVGTMLNLTHERVRQLELKALVRLASRLRQ